MANQKLNATITIGGAVASSLKSALGSTRDKLKEIGSAIRTLEREQSLLGKGIQTFGAMGKNVDGLRAKYASVTAEIEKARAAQQRLAKAHSGKEAGASRMASAGVAIGATAAVAATAFVPIIQAAAFEKAMLGVAKQVDGARDSSGKLTNVYYEMSKQIQLLGREMPIATNEIADMAAAGARMGIAKNELIGFTRTAGMMASAFDLPAGELADQMGKIANLFKIPIPNIGGLADAINYLDDNAISKGADIIDFLTRTGGVAGSVKVTGKEMAALGSTLLSLGERSETASTATNALFQKFAAADKGTKKFKSAMAEIGLSTAAVQKGMQIDSQGTILKVMDAINKLPKAKRTGVLVEMVGLEHSDTIAKLAGNLGEYRKQIEMANSQKAEGSMGREFAATLATTSAQFEITKNRLVEVGVNIGSVLLPAVNRVMGSFASATSSIADFVREHQTLVGNVIAVAATLGGLYAGSQAVSFGIGAVTFAFNAMKIAMMTNPIGLVIGVLAAAAALIYQNWEPIKAWWQSLWSDMLATITKAETWIMSKVQTIGNAWASVKSAFSFGGSAPAAQSAPATATQSAPDPSIKSAFSFGGSATAAQSAPTPPAPPTVPSRSGNQSSVVNNDIKITQNAGENSEDLANRIVKKMKHNDKADKRSNMYDSAMAGAY
jgi:TP901 family phage tail tape measure protein